MNREEIIGQLIISDPILKDLGVERVYRSTAPEDPTEKMFIILVWGEDTPRLTQQVFNRGLTAWIYDTPGYYGKIDAALIRLRGLMLDHLNPQVELNGDSADLYDDKYKRALRTGTYTVH